MNTYSSPYASPAGFQKFTIPNQQPPYLAAQSAAAPKGITNVFNNGQEAFMDLGDGYKLKVNKHNQQVEIEGPDGKKAVVWGDPHFKSADGSQFDFHKDCVIKLPNGTTINVDTTKADGSQPAAGSNEATYAGKVTVCGPDGNAFSIGNITGDKQLDLDQAGKYESADQFLKNAMPDYNPKGIMTLQNGQFKLVDGDARFLKPGESAGVYDFGSLSNTPGQAGFNTPGYSPYQGAGFQNQFGNDPFASFPGGHPHMPNPFNAGQPAWGQPAAPFGAPSPAPFGAPSPFGTQGAQNPEARFWEQQARQWANLCCDQMQQTGFYPRCVMNDPRYGGNFNPSQHTDWRNATANLLMNQMMQMQALAGSVMQMAQGGMQFAMLLQNNMGVQRNFMFG